MGKSVQSPRHRTAFTLVEVLVAGGILALLTCATLEGIIVAMRISKENAEHLAAEAFAFDLAWMKFNEEYTSLRLGQTSYDVGTLVPALAAWPDATAQTYVYTTNGISGKFIVSEVKWGPNNSRSVAHRIFRDSLSRVAGN